MGEKSAYRFRPLVPGPAGRGERLPFRFSSATAWSIWRPTHSTSRHSSWADSRSTPARRAESWMSPSEVATRTA